MNRLEANTPPKVSEEELRDHFKTVYRLAEDQVDVMVQSSAASLNTSLKALYEAVNNELSLEEVARHGHSIKGLLLNMGQHEWAELAREIELSAVSGREMDYKSMVEKIHQGMEEIL